MEVEIIEKTIQVKALVESESTKGAFYRVEIYENSSSCSCPHHTQRCVKCKHIEAVEETLNQRY